MLPDVLFPKLFRAARIVVPALATLGVPALASAHHSFAMFDYQKKVTLEGTVKGFQWMNPHVFIDVLVPGESGVSTWSVELSSPSHLVRNGWKPTSLKTGEQVRIVIHPLRDGRRGGAYVSATRADGTPVARPPGSTGDRP